MKKSTRNLLVVVAVIALFFAMSEGGLLFAIYGPETIKAGVEAKILLTIPFSALQEASICELSMPGVSAPITTTYVFRTTDEREWGTGTFNYILSCDLKNEPGEHPIWIYDGELPHTLKWIPARELGEKTVKLLSFHRSGSTLIHMDTKYIKIDPMGPPCENLMTFAECEAVGGVWKGNPLKDPYTPNCCVMIPTPPSCGNSVCEPALGESFGNCPTDCFDDRLIFVLGGIVLIIIALFLVFGKKL